MPTDDTIDLAVITDAEGPPADLRPLARLLLALAQRAEERAEDMPSDQTT